MKHLEKFIEYIKESKGNVSNEELEYILVHFTDMGIKYELSDEKTATKGTFAGKKFRSVTFSIKTVSEPGFNRWSNVDVTFDDKIWDFLDELITLKSRLEDYSDNKIGFYINQISGQSSDDKGWTASIYFLTGGEETGDVYELKKLFKSLEDKHNGCRSSFCYSMVKKLDLDKKEITVKTEEFSDRKWKTFTKGMDLSLFNIEKEEIPNRWHSTPDVKLTLTLKNNK